MPSVVGVDLSSFAVDLVKLDESTNAAEWHRCVPREARKGSDAPAWERTLGLPDAMPESGYWEDVYLVAIEAPYGASNIALVALNRVLGVIAASLPEALRRPERCWIVRPGQWRIGLGLKGNATKQECAYVVDDLRGIGSPDWPQDPLDAYAVAFYARELNARGVALEDARERQLVLV